MIRVGSSHTGSNMTDPVSNAVTSSRPKYARVRPTPANVAAMLAKYGIEPSLPLAWVVGITEFVGGICIILGFLTRFWAAGLVIDMAVAVIKVHLPNGFFWGKMGFEFPLTLGVMALILLLTGPGSLSVDRATGIEKRAS